MHRHLHKLEAIGDLMALLSFPLWWLTVKEVCTSQPPTFLILICAGYGIVRVISNSKLGLISGLINMGISLTFIQEAIYNDAFNSKYPMLIICISAGLCLFILLSKLFLRQKN